MFNLRLLALYGEEVWTLIHLSCFRFYSCVLRAQICSRATCLLSYLVLTSLGPWSLYAILPAVYATGASLYADAVQLAQGTHKLLRFVCVVFEYILIARRDGYLRICMLWIAATSRYILLDAEYGEVMWFGMSLELLLLACTSC